MSKRSQPTEDVEVPMNEEEDVVNVDFDFYDVAEDDYLSIKHLLRQLFDVDNLLFDLSKLAESVCKSKAAISIKTDGNESEPFAFVSLIELEALAESGLGEYLIRRTDGPETTAVNRTLRQLLTKNPKPDTPKAAIVLSERLLNMPLEIVPPLYTLFLQELKAKDLHYDYLIIPSRVYNEQASQIDESSQAPPTKKGSAGPGVYYFHIEDELFQPACKAFGSYPLENPIEETESRRVFTEYGILPRGFVSVAEVAKLEEAVAKLGEQTTA